MPINFNLEEIRDKYNCKNYFETGLWDPKDKTISFRKALECNFDKISSIEIRKDFIESGNNIFKEYIESGRCKDRKCTRLNSSHSQQSRMPSSA